MKRLLMLLGVLALLGPPVVALDFYVAPDVPVDLAGVPGSTTYPWTITRHVTPFTYTNVIAPPLPLPPDVSQPDALHLMNSDDWLFSVSVPTTFAGIDYYPEDVVLWDGALYSLFFCGAGVGIPLGINVDAAFLTNQTDTGSLVLSFDVPMTIGATTYDPADLVEFANLGGGCGGWIVASLYFDASAAAPPVPTSVNVTGADERHGRVVMTFDVPATLGPDFLPGELVAYDPGIPGFLSLHYDPAWAVSVRSNAFTLLQPPGRIPCTPPDKMEMDKGPAIGGVTFFWSASVCSGAEDYGLYEGTLGTWYSHGSVDCIDNGIPLEEAFLPAAGDYYYLVVPHNSNDEGSYGLKSVPPLLPPAERPVGAPTCQPTQELGCL